MNRGQYSNLVNDSQVHFGDTNHHHQTSQLRRQGSPPIPIKASATAIDRDNSRHDQVDHDYYNYLTWRMYHRIMEARRIKAYSRHRADEYTLAKLNSNIGSNQDEQRNEIEPSRFEGDGE
jgi:hypothetical protein